MQKTLDWFLERIGKRIFRDTDYCKCNTCKDVLENGLIIMDEQHARYLYDVENDFGCEGVLLNYRDEK